ncbi:DNA mismatch repair protein MutS [Lentiprolixibacter aurantiacus]|uniref:DNA mismatch repair protein MutS n=1 Tax=Lentiprolixibacter aurantiacus TaxID=2993939 RepID=A0AAE3MK21_9FLAO|nr:DNA mismatch repair protein MutS [Lentiprolixibacter aurantiacus]MCX2719081.1 DNA mismatch repair protein MutS [Lentiprolixibacter aurantiacus]
MQQYNSIKTRYPDALLLFRVGDFYETFGEDAVKAAGILDIILTHRNNGGDKTELAGFPHHALNTYLPKLVRAGQRVAICDQLEDPKQTKTIVKRGVTELVTPGVALNDDILQARKNNFLCAVHFGARSTGIALLDISTGEFLTAEGNTEQIDKLLQNFNPSEILISKKEKNSFAETFGRQWHLFLLDDWVFQEDYAHESLNTHFKTTSLKGFGVDHLHNGILASGAVLHYLSETRHKQLGHINKIQRIAEEEYIWMDRFTIRNLELYHSQHEQAVTLLEVIDKTLSSMGSRMIKRWLALPLKNIAKIKKRHEAVAHLVQDEAMLDKLQGYIKKIADLERLISKVATGKINPRETVQLKNSLEAIIPIRQQLSESSCTALKKLSEGISPCEALGNRIKEMLMEEAGTHIQKGDTIAPGYSEELDELRNLATSGKAYLDQMLERESERTGIPSLKIASNNVFGYYIEVRNTHKDKVPEEWIRKQTLVNAERYITEELKEYEVKILGAQERILELEQQLFGQLVVWMREYISPVQQNARAVAELDCLCGFAQLAKENRYVAPVMDDSTEIEILNGRHPVIEKQLPPGKDYVPNDVILNRDEQQIIMITGPNMSGKSALLRQTALIVLLAQMGSFVPADSARIGVVDKIFTRVGASDNISMGESTFMVEMNETATILNNLSERSLVLLDEIGRGTSTYDGISIAWAISEYLHEHPARAKTLFATHYHELNEMSATFERIKNYNVSVKELKDKVLFLRKLEPGGSEHSFGIHVAKMAGMPQQVIHKANKILKRLEQSHSSEELTEDLNAVQNEMQLSFFNLDDPLLEQIKEELVHLDINTLTPVEALMKLNEIKRMLSKNKRASS